MALASSLVVDFPVGGRGFASRDRGPWPIVLVVDGKDGGMLAGAIADFLCSGDSCRSRRPRLLIEGFTVL